MFEISSILRDGSDIRRFSVRNVQETPWKILESH